MQQRFSCPSCLSILPAIVKVEGSLDKHTSFEQINNAWIGIGKSSHFSYYECQVCGTLCNKDYPDLGELSRLYSSMPPNMAEAVSLKDQSRNQLSYARVIVDHASLIGVRNNPLSILELGADCGLLLAAIVDLLPQKASNMVAIEPNLEVHYELKERINQLAVNATCFVDLKDLPDNQPELFDIIAAVHVFDHVFDIGSLLKDLASKLSPRGFIFFVVHNPQSSVASLLGRKWPPYCAQHPQLFTRNGSAALAKGAGLKLVKSGRTINHFSLSMVTDFLGLKLPLVDRIPLMVPLGNRYYILEHDEVIK